MIMEVTIVFFAMMLFPAAVGMPKDGLRAFISGAGYLGVFICTMASIWGNW